MPMKSWLQQLQPAQLYIVLVLSICYFIIQLILSHLTHALTLLVDAYHMLCNIIALAGCILTIKHSKRKPLAENDLKQLSKHEESHFGDVSTETKGIHHHHHHHALRNTFGWTRIDVLTMLIVCIFLASLSFSLLVEALQTLVHIDHQDTMHLPVPILILGAAGLLLYWICYYMIGGYTLHQGSFLHITASGDVILDQAQPNRSGLKLPEGESSSGKRDHIRVDLSEVEFKVKRQGFVEICRDISSTLFVIVCAIIVYFADDEQVAKFVDPVMSICSCVLMLSLSYPYMKESCLILLQTIPGSIDIEIFKRNLLLTFKDIVNVHDLHIWQLTASKYVSTVHIIFHDPAVYTRIMNDIKNFFHEQGITIVTIQPEFQSTKALLLEECLVKCQGALCAEKHCCVQPKNDLREIVLHEHNKNKDKKASNLSLSKIFPFHSKDKTKSKSMNNLDVTEQKNEFKKSVSDSQMNADVKRDFPENDETVVNDKKIVMDEIKNGNEETVETERIACNNSM